MPEKNEQCKILQVCAKADWFAAEVQEFQSIKFHSFHGFQVEVD